MSKKGWGVWMKLLLLHSDRSSGGNQFFYKKRISFKIGSHKGKVKSILLYLNPGLISIFPLLSPSCIFIPFFPKHVMFFFGNFLQVLIDTGIAQAGSDGLVFLFISVRK
jgi:hypothetical protein